MKRRIVASLFLLVLLALPLIVPAQISSGGTPPGLVRGYRLSEPAFEKVMAPDIRLLNREDEQQEPGTPERMGVSLPVAFSPDNSGTWSRLDNGTRVWRLKVMSEGAIGLGLYFRNFHLAPGTSLFVYSDDGSHVIGAFTSENNRSDGFFATEVVKGDCIVIEYAEPFATTGTSGFLIEELLYVYRPMRFPGDQMNPADRAGDCQVNVACSEGDNWQGEARSVVRILIKIGWSSYWCSGVIMNNTASDYTPYILTADHCANAKDGYATPSDLARWIFYFLYQTDKCSNNGNGGDFTKTMTGARKIASSSPRGNNGSDFYLLLLGESIPPGYEPYYAGWDISGMASQSGVSIHHPAGDVKKISTYTTTLTNSQWGSNPGTHFRVLWSATENGHGTTEGGSSGSPLFNSQGRVIGQLTGGDSGCSNLEGPDYYGKISYSWMMNGGADSVRLKPWLDPLNTGLTFIDGSVNEKQVVARFIADTTVVAVGTRVSFSDYSLGNPESWQWYFEGGEPSESMLANPGNITYNNPGVFKVKLTVTNQFSTDSLVREKYIRVVPDVFPNPAQESFFVMLGQYTSGPDEIRVYDTRSRLMYQAEGIPAGSRFHHISCAGWPSGLYIVVAKNKDGVFPAKLMKVNR